MKLNTSCPYLYLFLFLTTTSYSQTIRTIYEPKVITNLLEGECRTTRLLAPEELLIHTEFNTIQFISLGDLYNVDGELDPQFFNYYVFREVETGLLLEATGMTAGLLMAVVKEAGVYYGVLNGPGCATVVRVVVGVNPVVCLEGKVYECCLGVGGLE